MAVPHYAYLKLRMPANRGPLTISGSFARSENCDKDFNNMDMDPPAQQNAPEFHSMPAKTLGSTRLT
jgi:hypothetical protein